MSSIITYITSFISSMNPIVPNPPPESGDTSTLPCKYRLDTSTSSTLTLTSGRALGYATYGDPLSDKAIIYCHGLPGSRLEAASQDAFCKELGLRLIAVERPGIGWSEALPLGEEVSILGHAGDIGKLVEYLKLDKYCVMGISGGSPYALACANLHSPTKLKGISIVTGLGPPEMGMLGSDAMHILGCTVIWPYFPWIAAWWLRRQVTGQLHLSDSQRFALQMKEVAKNRASIHVKDLPIFEDRDFMRLMIRSIREAFSQGFEGVCQDGRVMCFDWGFDIREIRKDLPVQLWYGSLDASVPLKHGVQIAGRIGGNARLVVDEETHASMQIKYQRRVLEDLGALLC